MRRLSEVTTDNGGGPRPLRGLGGDPWLTKRDRARRMAATPEDEARRIAAAMEYPTCVWELAGDSEGRWGEAAVCSARPARELHVIGASAIAEQLRELYASGAVSGWTLRWMPESRTPLFHYLDELTAAGPQPGSKRGYNQLDRAGFVYVEEVQACPDTALLDLRNIGETALRAVRDVLGYATPPIDVDETGAAAERHRHIRATVTPATAARYPELVRLLAQSRMPREAVDAICAALDAEALPPADKLVTMLLRTAGEEKLLALYRETHTSTADSE